MQGLSLKMHLSDCFHVQPKLGETTFSVLARARIRSGMRSPLDALKLLTGVRGYRPLSSLPNRLLGIRSLLGIEKSVEDIIDENTLINVYRPFLSVRREQFIVDGMKSVGSIKSRVGLLKSHCGAADQLAYCPRCREQDIFHDGFAYWRREHMLCGIYICCTHQTPLNIVDVTKQKYGTRFLFLPDGGESQLFSDIQVNRLIFIAEEVARLASSKLISKINPNSYLPLLGAAGLVTAANHIRIQNLQERVKEWMTPIKELFPFNQLYKALLVERSWVANLVAGKEGMHHPLKHIILWGALESDLESLQHYMDESLSQLPLNLYSKSKVQLTEEHVREALDKFRTASSAAKHLDCCTTTLLVSMKMFGIHFKTKPKILTDETVSQVLYYCSLGKSTADIADALKISVSSVNRLKRAYLVRK